MSYDTAYYEDIREGAKSSAEAVVPLIYEAVKPGTVVDVGCGEGWWGKAFEDRGCEVFGLDGPGATPVIQFEERDLAEGLTARGYDLVLCLEVAEHLSPERAKGFIADLCLAAPVVLFSAAIPNQGGEGHLNERWPAYWVGLFEKHGFACSAAPRWEIWNDDRVDSWYRQNLMVAAKDPAQFPQWFDTPLAHPYPVVHPAFMADLMEFIHNMARLGRIEWR